MVADVSTVGGPAAGRQAAADAAAPDSGLPATLAETTQLWWFADGAIMDPGTREHLHRSWGLCPRHAWMYFRIENEVKYQPLGCAVLLEDLVSRAARLLRSRHTRRHTLSSLQASDSCFTCDYVEGGTIGKPPICGPSRCPGRGAAQPSLVLPVTGGMATTHLPECTPTVHPQRTTAGVCRLHLAGELTSDAPANDSSKFTYTPADAGHRGTAPVAAYLSTLTTRLTTCRKSMTADGPPHTPDSDAALVEALGWCSGWAAAGSILA